MNFKDCVKLLFSDEKVLAPPPRHDALFWRRSRHHPPDRISC